MKRKKGKWVIFLPVIIAASLYLVFYSTIETKPTDAGFWFVLALGMSIGVVLVRLSKLFRK